MRFIRTRVAVLAAAAAMTLAACGSTHDADARVPEIADLGTRAFEYNALTDLATYASAVVVAQPTGKTLTKPFPGGDANSAPTPYTQMRVIKVISGALTSAEIEVVTPGNDIATGKSALLTAKEYLLFLTPAMYAANDPAGGYAIVGGPAGTYAQQGAGGRYVKVDKESPALPPTITLGDTAIPSITKSERQLLSEGPH